MRRRAFLGGLTITTLGTLTGCSTLLNTTGTPQTNTTTTTTQPPSTTPAADQDDWAVGAVSIVDLDTADRTYALGPTRYFTDDGGAIRMRFTQTATADHPATIEATLTNSNPFENTFRMEWTPPFGRLFSDSPHPLGERFSDHTYEASLLFAPTANHDLVDNPPSPERGPNGYWRLPTDTTPQLPERVRLAPNETIHGEYALVGRPTDGGRPPGVYEFSRADAGNVRVTVWPTDTPGPTTESQFSTVSVPPFSGEQSTAWYHNATPDTPSFVKPSTEQTDLPARVEFTFINRARTMARCGHWNFYKLQAGQWYHLGAAIHTADCRGVPPGGSKTWVLRATNGPIAPSTANDYPYLGRGRYAAVAGYGHATDHSAALLDINAPNVSVVPTEDVTSTQDGTTIQVTSNRWTQAADDPHQNQVTLVLSRASTAEETVITEQVMQPRRRALRNTLAFITPDTEEVRLRTNDRTADGAIGFDEQPRRFTYDNQPYELAVHQP